MNRGSMEQRARRLAVRRNLLASLNERHDNLRAEVLAVDVATPQTAGLRGIKRQKEDACEDAQPCRKMVKGDEPPCRLVDYSASTSPSASMVRPSDTRTSSQPSLTSPASPDPPTLTVPSGFHGAVLVYGPASSPSASHSSNCHRPGTLPSYIQPISISSDEEEPAAAPSSAPSGSVVLAESIASAMVRRSATRSGSQPPLTSPVSASPAASMVRRSVSRSGSQPASLSPPASPDPPSVAMSVPSGFNDGTGATVTQSHIWRWIARLHREQGIPLMREPNYKIISKIGSGSFGAVWKANKVVSGKTVALKKMRVGTYAVPGDDEGNLIVREQQLTSITREITLLHRCRENPNVVHFNAIVVGWDPQYVSVEMEFSPYNLRQIIESETYQPNVRDIRRIMLDIAMGVTFLHGMDVVHRDIKPANLLVTATGVVKVADLGLARDERDKVTPITPKKGTRAYMAPEVLMQQYYDGKHPLVDVWSMACVFCELANPKEGRSLFWAPSSLKQIVRIFEQLGQPTEDNWPGITTHPFFTEPANRVELDRVVTEHEDLIPLFEEVKGAGVVKLHDILMMMLALDPRRRIEADEAMDLFAEFYTGRC